METEEFRYVNGELYAEDLPVAGLAAEFGTPLFVYSRSHLRRQYSALADALAAVDLGGPARVFFAVKSNSNAAVIAALAGVGAGADVVSGNELWRARRAGVGAGDIVFAGVGKTRVEIAYALSEGIAFFTVESEPELARISECAVESGAVGRVAIRVNPDVDPRTHKYNSTGEGGSKFGVSLARAEAAFEAASELPGLEVVGLHMHLGSIIMSTRPWEDALDKVAALCRRLRAKFPTFRHIDIGGGIGIKYGAADHPPSPKQFAEAVAPKLRPLGLSVGVEPGRFISGNAGILVTRVEHVKEQGRKTFVIVDAGMNDLIRPALYGSHHEVLPVVQQVIEDDGKVDVVGPVCESGDFLAQGRGGLRGAGEGDVLAVLGAGAYAFAMSSNYNSRGRAAEVMVQGGRAEVVRRRETREDLVALEVLPEWDGDGDQ